MVSDIQPLRSPLSSSAVLKGLLDLAFDPGFTTNNFFYLSFTVNLGTTVS